jgi:hypothetical protein
MQRVFSVVSYRGLFIVSYQQIAYPIISWNAETYEQIDWTC